jgi:predicted nucleic acid-binding protein
MAYLLDTCVLSEFTKPRPSPSVGAWMSSISDTSQFVSVLTLGELEKGIQRLSKSKRRTALERWLEDIRSGLADRILPIDLAVAREWGRITARCEIAGQPIPTVDALLGATALVHGHMIVTRNTSDIARSGAPLLDPWR